MAKRMKQTKKSAPSSSGGVTTPAKLGVKQPEASAMRITHREYIGPVQGSVNFAVKQYSINPSVNSSFPWLAQLAGSFEIYRFERLAVVYSPACSTLTGGSVYLAFDYDANDPPPGSITQIVSYAGASRCAPWADARATYNPVFADKIVRFRNTRPYATPGGSDQRLYDCANFYVATAGTPAAGFLGELFVEYTIEFRIPQLESDSEGFLDSALVTSAPADSPDLLANTVIRLADPIRQVVKVIQEAGTNKLIFEEPGEYRIDASVDMPAPDTITTTPPQVTHYDTHSTGNFLNGLTNATRNFATYTMPIRVTKAGSAIGLDRPAGWGAVVPALSLVLSPSKYNWAV